MYMLTLLFTMAIVATGSSSSSRNPRSRSSSPGIALSSSTEPSSAQTSSASTRIPSNPSRIEALYKDADFRAQSEILKSKLQEGEEEMKSANEILGMQRQIKVDIGELESKKEKLMKDRTSARQKRVQEENEINAREQLIVMQESDLMQQISQLQAKLANVRVNVRTLLAEKQQKAASYQERDQEFGDELYKNETEAQKKVKNKAQWIQASSNKLQRLLQLAAQIRDIQRHDIFQTREGDINSKARKFQNSIQNKMEEMKSENQK